MNDDGGGAGDCVVQCVGIDAVHLFLLPKICLLSFSCYTLLKMPLAKLSCSELSARLLSCEGTSAPAGEKE